MFHCLELHVPKLEQYYREIYCICFTVRSYKNAKNGVKNLVWGKK